MSQQGADLPIPVKYNTFSNSIRFYMRLENRPCHNLKGDGISQPFVDLSYTPDAVQGPGPVPPAACNSADEELLLKTSLLDMAPDAMLLNDMQGNFIYVNKALYKMSGYSKEELFNNNAFQLAATGTGKAFGPYYTDLTEKGQSTLELVVTGRDGASHCIEIHSQVIEIGSKKYISSTVHDITRYKETDKALQSSYLKLQKTLDGFINTIATVSETRDPYTAGHQRQVSRLAQAIAGELDLSENTCEAVRIAGILHDIGKLSIPAEILSKPGKLSNAEFAIIKRHPEVGRDILKNIDFPWPISGIVSQHHERLDGSGYPDGLCGDNICREARILAVADVVEAMASHRPYRPSLGIDTALDEIEKNKGIKYDIDAVDACVRLVNQKGFTLY